MPYSCAGHVRCSRERPSSRYVFYVLLPVNVMGVTSDEIWVPLNVPVQQSLSGQWGQWVNAHWPPPPPRSPDGQAQRWQGQTWPDTPQIKLQIICTAWHGLEEWTAFWFHITLSNQTFNLIYAFILDHDGENKNVSNSLCEPYKPLSTFHNWPRERHNDERT